MKKAWILVLALCAAASARGLQAQSSDWKTVENLPRNQQIRITDFSHSETCWFVSADEFNLNCEHRRTVLLFITLHQRASFRKNEVLAVRSSRIAASALAGGAIGAASGAGIGEIIDAQAPNQAEEAHLLTILMGMLGAVIGGEIGGHKDFLAGPVLYRKP